MSNKFIVLASFIILISAAIFTSRIVWASGELTTSQSNQSGQVIIQDENGVLYLTNEIIPGESTTSARVIRIGDISAPRGFAPNITSVINGVLGVVMVLAGLLVLMYLVWGAIEWITSGGDKGKIESARSKMMAAVVGLIIVSASYAIMLLVIRFLGFRDLNDVLNSASTIDGSSQLIQVVDSTPTPTPSPTPTPVYSNTLRELNSN